MTVEVIFAIAGILFVGYGLLGRKVELEFKEFKFYTEESLDRWQRIVFIILGLVFIGIAIWILLRIDGLPPPPPTPTPTHTPLPTNTPVQIPTNTPAPTPPTVALLTHHGRYVTDVNDKNDLRAETKDLTDCEKFTLFCLDDDKVALKTCHGWYVTALNDEGDRDWKLRAYTKELNDWEKYTLFDVENERKLSCPEVLGLLKQGSVVIALKTHHGRYVTAQNDEGDRDWKLRAYTKELNDWEKFTLIPCQP
jgi:hypothetical protein